MDLSKVKSGIIELNAEQNREIYGFVYLDLISPRGAGQEKSFKNNSREIWVSKEFLFFCSSDLFFSIDFCVQISRSNNNNEASPGRLLKQSLERTEQYTIKITKEKKHTSGLVKQKKAFYTFRGCK